MNFLLEISLICVIIYLLYKIHFLKNNQLNVDSLKEENLILKNQLTEKESEFNSSIEKLNTSFNQEQIFLKERQAELDNKEKKLIEDIKDLENRLFEETEAKKKVTSQKKSSEVRLGNIAETLAPFLDQFEFDPEYCTFLGKPIDYISFGLDEITLIEVKSGNSQLNSRQRKIRDQVKAGSVSWKEIRIK